MTAKGKIFGHKHLQCSRSEANHLLMQLIWPKRDCSCRASWQDRYWDWIFWYRNLHTYNDDNNEPIGDLDTPTQQCRVCKLLLVCQNSTSVVWSGSRYYASWYNWTGHAQPANTKNGFSSTSKLKIIKMAPINKISHIHFCYGHLKHSDRTKNWVANHKVWNDH